jgi:hypothetical protein
VLDTVASPFTVVDAGVGGNTTAVGGDDVVIAATVEDICYASKHTMITGDEQTQQTLDNAVVVPDVVSAGGDPQGGQLVKG